MFDEEFKPKKTHLNQGQKPGIIITALHTIRTQQIKQMK